MSWKFIHSRFVERFWRLVAKGEGCWEWQGVQERSGYGRVSRDGQRLKAHRASWEITYGPIPGGLYVCHHCDNPICVRPDHLFLGDQYANMMDMRLKGREPARGEGRWAAKLKNRDIPYIRDLYMFGFTKSELGKMYGVSSVSIHKVITRQHYSHIH